MRLWETLDPKLVIRTIYQIGAHRAQELRAMRKAFPSLSSLALFDPSPRVRMHLQNLAANSPDIRFFPVAIGAASRRAPFYLTNNDQMSSSLLPMKEHLDLFPEVKVTETIEVLCSPLDDIIDEAELCLPDMLFLDVQGAEYAILESLSDRVLEHAKVIYTEVSKVEVYEGAKMLDDIIKLLCPRFEFKGYQPCDTQVLTHGDALFVKPV